MACVENGYSFGYHWERGFSVYCYPFEVKFAKTYAALTTYDPCVKLFCVTFLGVFMSFVYYPDCRIPCLVSAEPLALPY